MARDRNTRPYSDFRGGFFDRQKPANGDMSVKDLCPDCRQDHDYCPDCHLGSQYKSPDSYPC